MDFNNIEQIVQWGFYGMATFIGGGILSAITKLKDGVAELNIKVATVIEKLAGHEKELEKHDERLEFLERKK